MAQCIRPQGKYPLCIIWKSYYHYLNTLSSSSNPYSHSTTRVKLRQLLFNDRPGSTHSPCPITFLTLISNGHRRASTPLFLIPHLAPHNGSPCHTPHHPYNLTISRYPARFTLRRNKLSASTPPQLLLRNMNAAELISYLPQLSYNLMPRQATHPISIPSSCHPPAPLSPPTISPKRLVPILPPRSSSASSYKHPATISLSLHPSPFSSYCIPHLFLQFIHLLSFYSRF